VKDNQTGLTWQQAVDANTYSSATATTYCTSVSLSGTGWRLPTRAELLTLVDPTQANPAIDPTAFPNTPNADFWSSSPYVGWSGNAWYVSFNVGSSHGGATSNADRVRCVR
jgi:hypothetical protein